MVAVTPHMLGVIHRRIGVKHQLPLVFAIVRIDSNPDAEGNHQVVEFKAEGLIDYMHQRAGQRRGIVRGIDLGQQNKLVTANTGEGVLTFQRLLKAFCDGNQQLVTGVMPVGIVNGFEAVQIHKQQRE